MAAENSINNECHDLNVLFSSEGRDFLIRNNGDKVEIKALSGKTVGLYFSASWCPPCRGFTPKLIETYKELSSKGDFEVVFVSADRDEESFNGYFSKMPWLAIPFSDSTVKNSLDKKFQVMGIPHLVILNGEGKVLTDSGVELVMEHQAKAYPFTPERINQLKEEEEAAKRNQTLESLLVSGSRDYVVSSDGNKVPVSQLVGKHVLIYFSAHWCPPCRGFTPKLVKTYHEMKAKGNEIEVIFASSDKDQSSFDEYYSEMPWLALPFGDERKAFLSHKFKVRGIPCLVAIGPEGKTITTETRNLIETHGSDAFPFTEDHLKALIQKLEDIAKGWPEKVKHELHEHELVKVRRNGYFCDGCGTPGSGWSFWCKECDYDLDPKCALANSKEVEEKEAEGETKEGYICEGDVCRKI